MKDKKTESETEQTTGILPNISYVITTTPEKAMQIYINSLKVKGIEVTFSKNKYNPSRVTVTTNAASGEALSEFSKLNSETPGLSWKDKGGRGKSE